MPVKKAKKITRKKIKKVPKVEVEETLDIEDGQESVVEVSEKPKRKKAKKKATPKKNSAKGGPPPIRSDVKYGLRTEASERTGALGGKEVEMVEGEDDFGLEDDVVEEKPIKEKKIKMTKKKKQVVAKVEKEEDVEEGEEEDEEGVEKNLQQIYENKDGSMPDMKHFQRKRRSKMFAVIVFILSLGLLVAVAWAGFTFFEPQTQFSQQDVILSVSGEEEVMIGDIVTYRVRYGNGQRVQLAKAVLQIRYPDGFVFESAEPTPTTGNNDTWELGSLDQLDSGFIDITGRIFGGIDETQSFRAFLNYFPGDFSSEFQSVATAEVKTSVSPVSIRFDGPEEIAPGINTGFTLIVYKAEDIDEPIENLRVVLEESDGFNKKDSTPESDEFESLEWSIDSFEEETKIVVNGSFSANDISSEKTLKVKVVGWKDEVRENGGYEYASVDYTVRLLQTDLGIDVVINGARNNFTVQPNETLSTSIVIKNTGEDTIKNVRARLTFDAPSYNKKSLLYWSELDDENGGSIFGEQMSDTLRRGVITWDKSDISDLSSLSPGESVIVDVHLPIKTTEVIDLTDFTTYDIIASVDVQYEANGEDSLVSSDPINIVINSDLDIEVRDEVSVSGDGKDIHTVTWLLTNSFHAIEGIEITAEIYGDITWDESALVVPAGDITWDAESQKLTWIVESMPEGVDVLALQFASTLNSENPSQTNLMSKVILKARDSVTGEEMFILGDEILLNVEEEEVGN